jgi:hypothetical protein
MTAQPPMQYGPPGPLAGPPVPTRPETLRAVGIACIVLGVLGLPIALFILALAALFTLTSGDGDKVASGTTIVAVVGFIVNTALVTLGIVLVVRARRRRRALLRGASAA